MVKLSGIFQIIVLLNIIGPQIMFCRMSGRDLRDICQQAERQWASKVGNCTLISHVLLLIHTNKNGITTFHPSLVAATAANSEDVRWRAY